MKYFITGGCGFVGINLALSFSKKIQKEITVIDNLSKKTSLKNLNLLKKTKINFVNIDIAVSKKKINNLIKKFKPRAIFHLAGQVAMSTSIKDPYLDFNGNVKSTINILEAIRLYSKKTSLIFASSNKVYGDLNHISFKETKKRFQIKKNFKGFSENNNLDFKSPYGCSKGSADQYVLDYARIFGLNTTVFRHSSIYGGRQFFTYDQGWLGWFCAKAVKNKLYKEDKFSITGNGKQVRDIVHIDDVVNLYRKSITKISKLKGNAYNIGGGVKNSLSILELIDFLNSKLDIKLKYYRIASRPHDQKVFISDNKKIYKDLKWKPKISFKKGIVDMINWIRHSKIYKNV